MVAPDICTVMLAVEPEPVIATMVPEIDTVSPTLRGFPVREVAWGYVDILLFS